MMDLSNPPSAATVVTTTAAPLGNPPSNVSLTLGILLKISENTTRVPSTSQRPSSEVQSLSTVPKPKILIQDAPVVTVSSLSQTLATTPKPPVILHTQGTSPGQAATTRLAKITEQTSSPTSTVPTLITHSSTAININITSRKPQPKSLIVSQFNFN